jgi:hypothetical protein
MDIDMRAEVGHLTRRVVVRGDDDSEHTKWGAHIMLHSPGDELTIGRFSHMECFMCGQAFNLGRYPIHLHMMGNVRKSYIKGCAVHRTFNRAVTIHGVSHFRVLNNVAYDNMGHAFFFEDAAETHNRVEGNLAMVWERATTVLKPPHKIKNTPMNDLWCFGVSQLLTRYLYSVIQLQICIARLHLDM